MFICNKCRQQRSTTRSFSKVERLFIFESMSSCIDATCCSCDPAVKRTLDCLLVDVAAFGDNSFTQLSQIVGLLIMRHIPNSVVLFVNTVEQNTGFLDQLIVSDEAIFSLNWEINTRNVRKYASHGNGYPAANPEQQPCFSKF